MASATQESEAGSGAGAGAGIGAGAGCFTPHAARAAAKAAAEAAASDYALPLSSPPGTVRLRAYEPGDVDSVQRHANERLVWINLRDKFPHPYTRDDAEMWVGLQVKCKPPVTHVVIEVGGQFAGSIGIELQDLTDVHRHSAELGYWLGRDFWGKGVMSEAVRLFVRYAFSHFDLLRIEAGCFARNAASARVLLKNGFLFEGALRQSVVKDGVVLDQHMHSLLRHEVFGRRAPEPEPAAAVTTDGAHATGHEEPHA